MPDLNGDGIITVDEIQQELMEYYSKTDMQKILECKSNKNDVYTKDQIDAKLNKMMEDILSNVSGGTVNLANYYTKDEVNDIVGNLKVKTIAYKLTVDTDNQSVFNISIDPRTHATLLIFNTVLRTDYTISDSTLTTSFSVPLGANLTLISIILE